MTNGFDKQKGQSFGHKIQALRREDLFSRVRVLTIRGPDSFELFQLLEKLSLFKRLPEIRYEELVLFILWFDFGRAISHDRQLILLPPSRSFQLLVRFFRGPRAEEIYLEPANSPRKKAEKRRRLFATLPSHTNADADHPRLPSLEDIKVWQCRSDG